MLVRLNEIPLGSKFSHNGDNLLRGGASSISKGTYCCYYPSGALYDTLSMYMLVSEPDKQKDNIVYLNLQEEE